jgi:hypothetical protein
VTDIPSADEARQAAVGEVATATRTPASGELVGAVVGAPVLVHSVAGQPSYQLVPLRLAGGARGFVRVGPGGRVQAVGRYGGPAPVTMDPADVATRVASVLRGDEEAGAPRLVHDGPPGREAWLVVVSVGGAPSRWLFVGPGGVHERSPGTPREAHLE